MIMGLVVGQKLGREIEVCRQATKALWRKRCPPMQCTAMFKNAEKYAFLPLESYHNLYKTIQTKSIKLNFLW